METQKKKKEAKQEQKNKEAEENDNNNDKEIIQQEFLDKRDDKRDEKIAELTDTLKRLQADFENYKKRADREKDTYSKNANTRLIEKFLSLLDSFALAIKNSNVSDFDKFRKGIEMIYAQFYSILQNEGLRPIEALGKKFDPYKHEVLMQEESEQDNIVLEEFQKGYMLHDHILRHSKVKIGAKKDLVDASENNSENKNSESDEQNQKENQGKNQE